MDYNLRMFTFLSFTFTLFCLVKTNGEAQVFYCLLVVLIHFVLRSFLGIDSFASFLDLNSKKQSRLKRFFVLGHFFKSSEKRLEKERYHQQLKMEKSLSTNIGVGVVLGIYLTYCAVQLPNHKFSFVYIITCITLAVISVSKGHKDWLILLGIYLLSLTHAFVSGSLQGWIFIAFLFLTLIGSFHWGKFHWSTDSISNRMLTTFTVRSLESLLLLGGFFYFFDLVIPEYDKIESKKTQTNIKKTIKDKWVESKVQNQLKKSQAQAARGRIDQSSELNGSGESTNQVSEKPTGTTQDQLMKQVSGMDPEKAKEMLKNFKMPDDTSFGGSGELPKPTQEGMDPDEYFKKMQAKGEELSKDLKIEEADMSKLKKQLEDLNSKRKVAEAGGGGALDVKEVGRAGQNEVAKKSDFKKQKQEKDNLTYEYSLKFDKYEKWMFSILKILLVCALVWLVFRFGRKPKKVDTSKILVSKVDREIAKQRINEVLGSQKTKNEKVIEIYLALLALLAKSNFPKEHSEAPSLYSHRLGQASREFKEPMSNITETFCLSLYGNEEINKEKFNDYVRSNKALFKSIRY